MISLERAKKILDDFSREFLIASQEVEPVPLWEAGGRILAVDIIAHEDVPAFNRSHVDGYALLSADTCEAAADNPVTLRIIDTIAAGSYSRKKILPRTAMKIFTGAPLPLEADCIIKMEETEEIVADYGPAVVIKRPVSVGENLSKKGEKSYPVTFCLATAPPFPLYTWRSWQLWGSILFQYLSGHGLEFFPRAMSWSMCMKNSCSSGN